MTFYSSVLADWWSGLMKLATSPLCSTLIHWQGPASVGSWEGCKFCTWLGQALDMGFLHYWSWQLLEWSLLQLGGPPMGAWEEWMMCKFKRECAWRKWELCLTGNFLKWSMNLRSWLSTTVPCKWNCQLIFVKMYLALCGPSVADPCWNFLLSKHLPPPLFSPLFRWYSSLFIQWIPQSKFGNGIHIVGMGHRTQFGKAETCYCNSLESIIGFSWGKLQEEHTIISEIIMPVYELATESPIQMFEIQTTMEMFRNLRDEPFLEESHSFAFWTIANCNDLKKKIELELPFSIKKMMMGCHEPCSAAWCWVDTAMHQEKGVWS